MMKSFIRAALERKVRKYLKKHKPLLVLITGSVGKTSTKQAIATVLNEKYRVRAHDGNHNTHFSVPTAIMGVEYPSNPRSFSEWRAVLRAMSLRIKEEKDVDVIIQELGTDTPGDIAQFGRYLTADVAVVTAVSEEHMEFFETMDAVAQEELSIAKFAKLTIVNRDDIDENYAKYADTHTIDTYGLGEKAEYRLIPEPASPIDGRIGRLVTPEWGELTVTLQLVGDHSLKAAVAAACVGAKLGLTSQHIANGISKIKPVPGRMQVLRGQMQSTIIDDTYNASPLAVTAALQTLMNIEAPQRIAILGSMNELGKTSAQAHEMIGLLCDPTKIEWVVTIGDEAERYLAPAATKKGCQVKSFKSPYEAGGFVHKVIKTGAVVLAKGSQNGVFAEEAVKVLLHSTEDEEKLVRQSEYWLQKKDDQFDRPVPED
ncbi:MAG TPA: Mur ligase family protein [Candidatus Saccharibacteria bacterium]|nr:Mur ligase family protein [Candidatus Saccharibacteria bacterium]